MASKQIGAVVLSCFIAIIALAFRPCASVEPMDGGWSDAGATWYGPANGAGSDGTLRVHYHACIMCTYVFIANAAHALI
jgi:hypothetical protein